MPKNVADKVQGKIRYEVKPMHDWWTIVYVASGSIVYSARRKSDVMRHFNRYYVTANGWSEYVKLPGET